LTYNDSRECKLSGEARFKVAKDADHPFVIHSDQLTVTVLGTEFDFISRAGEGISKLTLYSGSVKLHHPVAGSYIMDEAGHEFSFDHASETATVCEFDTAEQPDWVAGGARLEVHSLGEIFRSIEAARGVRFENMASIDTSQRFSFEMIEGGSLETMLSALQKAGGGFDYTINGTTIILKPKH
jgi:ferric-dicitrate binding protein FerR (iron transport regulator)